MPLRITWNCQASKNVRDFNTDRLVIGRFGTANIQGLDLSADFKVSRQHAVIDVKDNIAWLTDLGSRFGTQVNGRDIRGQGEKRLWPDDTILIGQTTLRVTLLPEATPDAPVVAVADSNMPLPGVMILKTIKTDRCLSFGQNAATPATAKCLAMFLDLPRQLAGQASQSELLQTVMNRVVAAVPCARRGALLMCDSENDALLLKAYVSPDEPAVSETLARRALNEKHGFIWRSSVEDSSQSVLQYQIVTGMYAPLQWQDRVFGVICVDTPVVTDMFREADLEFLIAIGQYAAMTLADQQVRAELHQSNKLVDRLLANFSPEVRALLLQQASEGKLRPGGVKSEITVLFCDICGFTLQTANMDARDVVDMLNDYFEPMVATIFCHDGTVDKFVGDAVLAVFGSPQADPQHHQKAVRAALAIQQAVQATSRLRAARGDVTCRVRIGLHCGEVFHGFIGTVDRLEFTVIGDAVNRASRYCEGACEGEVLISSDVFEHVFYLIKADKTTIQTKEGPLTAYRVKELKP
jgi:adenylate cyclase